MMNAHAEVKAEFFLYLSTQHCEQRLCNTRDDMLKGLRGAWLRGTRALLQAALGPLERAVMDTIWRGGRLSVREVQAQLANPSAYTTVMTTLDRLFKKGLVQRSATGAPFYSAAIERHELETSMTTGLLNGMLSSGPRATRPFLANLVDAVGDTDNALLDQLEQLVRDKRERIEDKRQGDKAGSSPASSPTPDPT